MATWTDDLELSTRMVPEVVHFTGRAELLDAVQHGMAPPRPPPAPGEWPMGPCARSATGLH